MLYMCAAQTVMLVQIGCYTAQNITKKTDSEYLEAQEAWNRRADNDKAD